MPDSHLHKQTWVEQRLTEGFEQSFHLKLTTGAGRYSEIISLQSSPVAA
jgi:hypothetical protein